MELALGTVQFGLAYGIAGRGQPVPEREVRDVLARAWEHGVRMLDTAAAYGDIEHRLSGLMAPHPFRVVTKIPPLPLGLPTQEVEAWALQALGRAERSFGEALEAVMLHRADDLLGPAADALWEACSVFADRTGVKLGVSCYAPETLEAVRARYPVDVAQLPGNAWDQRVASRSIPSDVSLHLRSAFLQGLLLMAPQLAVARLPVANAALARWHAWCEAQGCAPLVAALRVVKSLPGGSHCVVGIDSLQQLEEVCGGWHDASPLPAPELAVTDLEIIDPRRWCLRS